MIGRHVGVLVVVMVACTAFTLAVESLNITKITWTYDSGDGEDVPETTSLLVCTSEEALAAEGDFIRLVVKTETTEKTFEGTTTENSNCSTFTEEAEFTLPSGEAAVYKLTVSDSTETEQKSGSVSFAYPITMSEIIDCEWTQLGRLTLDLTVEAPSNCLQGSGYSPDSPVCYVDSVDGVVCLSGLDTSNANFEVCTTNVPSAVAVDAGPFSVKYLEYMAEGGTISIEHGVPEGNVLSELLSSVEGGDGSMSAVHSCTNDLCVLSSFLPSHNNYQLCGVFVSDTVTNVGTTSFQDLELTVDSIDPVVNFHFYNVLQDLYNVYENPDLSGFEENPSFILNCSLIPNDFYCYGFFLPDSSPAKIGVSYANASNAVVASVDQAESA